MLLKFNCLIASFRHGMAHMFNTPSWAERSFIDTFFSLFPIFITNKWQPKVPVQVSTYTALTHISPPLRLCHSLCLGKKHTHTHAHLKFTQSQIISSLCVSVHVCECECAHAWGHHLTKSKAYWCLLFSFAWCNFLERLYVRILKFVW